LVWSGTIRITEINSLTRFTHCLQKDSLQPRFPGGGSRECCIKPPEGELERIAKEVDASCTPWGTEILYFLEFQE
jgi:hypothetical protein